MALGGLERVESQKLPPKLWKPRTFEHDEVKFSPDGHRVGDGWFAKVDGLKRSGSVWWDQGEGDAMEILKHNKKIFLKKEKLRQRGRISAPRRAKQKIRLHASPWSKRDWGKVSDGCCPPVKKDSKLISRPLLRKSKSAPLCLSVKKVGWALCER